MFKENLKTYDRKNINLDREIQLKIDAYNSKVSQIISSKTLCLKHNEDPKTGYNTRIFCIKVLRIMKII